MLHERVLKTSISDKKGPSVSCNGEMDISTQSSHTEDQSEFLVL